MNPSLTTSFKRRRPPDDCEERYLLKNHENGIPGINGMISSVPQGRIGLTSVIEKATILDYSWDVILDD